MRFQPFASLLRLLFAIGIVASPVATESAWASDGFRVLHSFCKKAGCPDGGPALAGVILGESGSLLGTASGGAANGVLFHLAPNAQDVDTVYTRLHNFCGGNCRDGGAPDFPLIEDASGNAYGTTAIGGAHGGGTIFEASPGGKVAALHAFCSGNCKTGYAPSSGVTYQGEAFGQRYDGSAPLYGTASVGGSLNGGAVYAFMRQDGKSQVKTLYNFCSTLPCADGAMPMGGLTLDSAGNIFGIANLGGAQGEGAVFELSRVGGKYKYTAIYNFCSAQNCTDGTRPDAGVAIDSAGNLFGTTFIKGEHDAGTIYELSPYGNGYSFQVLYQFCSEQNCTDGGVPEAPLTLDSSGNLFGTAAQFGNNFGGGTLFELSHGGNGWTQSVLHSFCAQPGCAGGASPNSPLTMDSNGNLFGSTAAGGASNSGVVFELKR